MNVLLGLKGPHQVMNAQLAMAALEISGHSIVARVSSSAARRGLEHVCTNTAIQGRLENIGRTYILDVAHNPAAVAELVQYLRGAELGRLVVVFGVLRDKDYREMLRMLSSVARLIVAVVPQTGRALGAPELLHACNALRMNVAQGGGVAEGLRLAQSSRLPGERILVTGSFYTVGEARETLVTKS
jgi:dihydrofolate synthase/folylpolyglutamate synthase